MIVNCYDKARLEKLFPGCKFKAIEKDYEKNHVYFCGYWHKYFKVIDIKNNVPVWNTLYIVQWENGEISSHATKADRKYDYEIR